jgi:hypothetical protein
MQLLEQQTSRLLFDLATGGVDVTLSFVFSHVGGAPGNEYADQLAEEALKAVGRRWPGDVPPRNRSRTIAHAPTQPLWHIDTTRRANNDRHRAADKTAGRRDDTTLSFRFRSMPLELLFAPSSPLPREMARKDEIAVYRARLGMLTRVGGSFAGQRADCPICHAADVLGRDGATFTHVVGCVRTRSRDIAHLQASKLWTNPRDAAATLTDIDFVLRHS